MIFTVTLHFMKSEVLKTRDIIEKSDIINSEIDINCKINNIEFSIKTIDIIGHIIQEWFGLFLTKNKIKWSAPDNTQEYPDFILDHDQHLELKCYDATKRAAFDLANFKSLIDDLVINPQRINTDYIVFNYKLSSNQKYIINDYRIRKIWQMTTSSTQGRTQGLITAQQKKGVIYNLRPYGSFFSNPDKTFNNKGQFLYVMSKTIDSFSDQLIDQKTSYNNGTEWLNIIQNIYKTRTGKDILTELE